MDDADVDIARCVNRTIENVPKGARPLFGRCVALAADAMLAADEDVRVKGDVLSMLIPRLLLTPFPDSWWASSSLREFRRRCQKFLSGKWEELWEDSEPYAAGTCDASEATQYAEVAGMRREEADKENERTKRQQQLDYAVKLVKKAWWVRPAPFCSAKGPLP